MQLWILFLNNNLSIMNKSYMFIMEHSENSNTKKENDFLLLP